MVGRRVSVEGGVFVGASVSVGRGDGLSVAAGSGLRVFVTSNQGAARFDVLGGATWVGVLWTGKLHARMASNQTKITAIRFMARL